MAHLAFSIQAMRERFMRKTVTAARKKAGAKTPITAKQIDAQIKALIRAAVALNIAASKKT